MERYWVCASKTLTWITGDWAEATISEQREALSIFRRITAIPEGLAFEVPDLAVSLAIALETGRSAAVEVAAPGLVWSADIPFRLVTA